MDAGAFLTMDSLHRLTQYIMGLPQLCVCACVCIYIYIHIGKAKAGIVVVNKSRIVQYCT